MNEVRVAGFRCFHEEQTALLAPLTLLVGENSTGKTSFLALIRVLWDAAFGMQPPDFTERPFDLGSFAEVVHDRGTAGGAAESFEAGFSMDGTNLHVPRELVGRRPYRYQVTFRNDNSGIIPAVRRVESGSASLESRIVGDGRITIIVATSKGQWKVTSRQPGLADRDVYESLGAGGPPMPLSHMALMFVDIATEDPERLELINAAAPPDERDTDEIFGLVRSARWGDRSRPFGTAPVRSRPRRTYDVTSTWADPEGASVPMLLATLASAASEHWDRLKASIEQFGVEAGLFDDLKVKMLGGAVGGPFQLQVRKSGTGANGPFRNVIDVGYGVSQALPIAAELLRPGGPPMFLLQQPEVHLHPSAQAGLGSFFCGVAEQGPRQLLVETHSDHLIDRVRMDVRDRRTKLKPEDVSILYFERRNLAVTIHSLGWDKNGGLVAKKGEIPEGYRQFFRTERRRSLGW